MREIKLQFESRVAGDISHWAYHQESCKTWYSSTRLLWTPHFFIDLTPTGLAESDGSARRAIVAPRGTPRDYCATDFSRGGWRRRVRDARSAFKTVRANECGGDDFLCTDERSCMLK